MPPTTLRLTFIKNLRDKDTNATQTLDKINREKEAIMKRSDLWNQLQADNALEAPLGVVGKNDKIKEWLANNGFSVKDFEHIDEWPNTTPPAEGRFGKEAVRRAIVYAINHDIDLKFRWYLHRGEKTKVVFTPIVGANTITVEIVFLNPFKKVKPEEATDDVQIIIDEPQNS